MKQNDLEKYSLATNPQINFITIRIISKYHY